MVSLLKQRDRRWRINCLLVLAMSVVGFSIACADPAMPSSDQDQQSQSASPAAVSPAQLEMATTTRQQMGAGQPPANGSILPIDLPYALRLVNASNPTIAIARERVREAYARQLQANVLWVPNLWVGGNPDNLTFLPMYYQHDGQIENSRGQVFGVVKSQLAFVGGTGLNFSFADAFFAPRIARNLTSAEQARSRVVTYGVQLDAALTYLDLLRVYGAIAITNEALSKALVMLGDATTAERAGLTKTTADANRARTEVELLRKQQFDLAGEAAFVSARLAQLLLLEPTVDLVPADTTVLPIALVPTEQSLDELVGIGLMTRPELAESRALVAAALARWRQERTRPLLPTLQMAFYGAQFGGGTPGIHDYGGRDDFLVQATWELKNGGLGNLYQARATRSQYEQANLHVTEVQAMVAAEVVSAAKLVRQEQAALLSAQEAVRQAEEMWIRLTKMAFGLAVPAQKYDPLEPLLAEQALREARLQYLATVIEFNRNQFRLYWAMGQPPLAALPTATPLPVDVPVAPTTTTVSPAPPAPAQGGGPVR